jgi:hypothetical protein
MKKLPLIPDSILRRHDQAFFLAIKSALDIVIGNNCLVFPRRKKKFIAGKKSLSSQDISDLTVIRNLFVQFNLLTATAAQIRTIAGSGIPTATSLSARVIDLLSELFNYSEFQQGRILVFRNQKFYWESPKDPDDAWGGYEFLQYHTMSLKYCPYCNADTVYAFRKDNKNRTKVVSALDHFYPKSKYPYLALSLYNLIPACSRCNSQMKGGADMTKVANPYIEDVHRHVVFFPVIDKVASPLNRSCSMAILPRHGCSSKAIEFVRRFELESFYSSAFAEDAWLCMEKVRSFTPEFRLDIARRINQSDPRLVETLLFGMPLSEDEINKTRLGKMTLDIVERYQ